MVCVLFFIQNDCILSLEISVSNSSKLTFIPRYMIRNLEYTFTLTVAAVKCNVSYEDSTSVTFLARRSKVPEVR